MGRVESPKAKAWRGGGGGGGVLVQMGKGGSSVRKGKRGGQGATSGTLSYVCEEGFQAMQICKSCAVMCSYHMILSASL